MTSLRSLLRRNRPGKLGLVEVVAMGVGGMVSGGIYAVLRTLKQITEFGSVAFLIADAVANYVNLQLADETGSNRLFPALGLLGTVTAILIVLYHLYRTDIGILLWIVGIFGSLFLLEFLYIERQPFDPGIHAEG